MTEDRAIPGRASLLRRARKALNSPLGALVAIAGILLFACPRLSPVDARSLLSYARELSVATGYHSLRYSNAKGRPFETCPTSATAHAALFETLRSELDLIAEESSSQLLRIRKLGDRFDAHTHGFYAAECPEPWQYRYHLVDYQKGLIAVAPQLWIFEDFGLSEIWPALLQLIGSWIGVVALFLITRRLSSSTLLGILAVVMLEPIFLLLRVSGTQRLDVLNTFNLILVAMTLAAAASGSTRSRALALSRDVIALLGFAALSVLFLFFKSLPSRIDASLVPAIVVLVGLVNWDRRTILRGLVALAVLVAAMAPFNGYSAGLLEPVSALNTAQSEELKLVQFVQYLFERPNPFGQFILDHNLSWAFDQDFHIRRNAPVLSLHQSGPAWGSAFLLETLRKSPLEFPQAWWKRLFVQIVDHQRLSFGMYGRSANAATWFFWIAVAALGLCLAIGSHTRLAWPAAALVLWEVFGLHTFLALTHTHSFYSLKGVSLLWCMFLAFLGLALRQLWRWRESPLARAIGAVRGSRRLQALTAVGVLLAALSVPYFIREARKEMHATNVWYAIHVGTADASAHRHPEALLEEIESIRELGHDAPGAVDMYAAWAMFGYNERIPYYVRFHDPEVIEDNARRARQLTLEHYERGLVEDPGNRYFPVFARYFGDPSWAERYRDALTAFPEHPYAPMMSWRLATESTLSAAQKRGYMRTYETSVGRLFAATTRFRPGFKRLPRLGPAAGGGALLVEPDDTGVLVRLAPRASALVEAIDPYSSDRVKVGLFVDVQQGRLVGSLVDGSGARRGEKLKMRRRDLGSYRIFRAAQSDPPELLRIRLRAGPRGARFVVRDLYPMIENPRFFRDRARRAAGEATP